MKLVRIGTIDQKLDEFFSNEVSGYDELTDDNVIGIIYLLMSCEIDIYGFDITKQANLATLVEHIQRFRYNEDFFLAESAKVRGYNDIELAFALEKFQDGWENSNFGMEHLRSFLKKNRVAREEELRKFGLVYDTQLRASQYGQRFLFREYGARYNFCLTFEHELVASAGFNAEAGKITITQVQGVKSHINGLDFNRERLAPYNWARALLSYGFQWAIDHKVPVVEVLSFDNLKDKDSFGLQQGKRLYDGTARKLGAKKGENGNYFFYL